MNVTFPLAGLNISGGVKNLVLQANALAAAGHRVRLIVPDFAARSPFALDPRVRVEVLATGGSRARYYARLASRAARGADVCVAAFYLTVWCSVLSRVLRRSRTRVVYSVAAYEPLTHGWLAPSSLPGRLGRTALAWLSYCLPSVERVYASEWLRARVGDPHGPVIGRGLDLSIFSPRASADGTEPVRVGAIGRSGAVKGYDVLLRALRDFDLPIDLTVVDVDGVSLPTYVAVERLGALDERGMAEFYRSCDVFVFTSRNEGFPAPPLEAMASGCAVLSTDCGGVREYAVNDQNCLLVPPDDPLSLSAALRRLCTDAALRERLATAGVATAARFDRQQMLDRFVAIVERFEV